jgi:hypothetical protein
MDVAFHHKEARRPPPTLKLGRTARQSYADLPYICCFPHTREHVAPLSTSRLLPLEPCVCVQKVRAPRQLLPAAACFSEVTPSASVFFVPQRPANTAPTMSSVLPVRIAVLTYLPSPLPLPDGYPMQDNTPRQRPETQFPFPAMPQTHLPQPPFAPAAAPAWTPAYEEAPHVHAGQAHPDAQQHLFHRSASAAHGPAPNPTMHVPCSTSANYVDPEAFEAQRQRGLTRVLKKCAKRLSIRDKSL